jgi:hypothetical protein
VVDGIDKHSNVCNNIICWHSSLVFFCWLLIQNLSIIIIIIISTCSYMMQHVCISYPFTLVDSIDVADPPRLINGVVVSTPYYFNTL